MARDAELTKATILEAARIRFAQDGYERATIRAIAAEAEIDPALVMRYFGNKEKLFAAAADFDLRLPEAALLNKERARVGERLVAHFIDRWEDDDTFVALLRASATNEAAAKRIKAVLSKQVLPTIMKLSADKNASRAAVRSALVASQLLGLAMCRYVLRLPPLADLAKEEVMSWVGPTLQRYITE